MGMLPKLASLNEGWSLPHALQGSGRQGVLLPLAMPLCFAWPCPYALPGAGKGDGPALRLDKALTPQPMAEHYFAYMSEHCLCRIP